MKRRIAVLFALFLISPQVGWAYFSSNDAGRVGAAFLQLGVGARALAVGEAYTTFTQGADSLFWNPSGLAKTESSELMFNHQPLFDQLTYSVGGAAIRAGRTTFGFGYASLRYGDIDQLDPAGEKTASYEPTDEEAILGVGRSWGDIHWGMCAKYIRSTIGSVSAKAAAVDVGLGIPNPLLPKFSHTLVLQNIGSKIKFDEQEDPLPVVAKLGSSYAPIDRFKLGFDAVFPKGSDAYIALGGELTHLVGQHLAVALRAGTNTRSKDVGGLSGLGLGGGLILFDFCFDYAWVPQEDFGSSQILTLTIRFGP